MENGKKYYSIILFPFLFKDTTSANRFKSFLEAIHYLCPDTIVLDIQYPLIPSYPHSSESALKEREFDSLIVELEPQLSLLQKFAFKPPYNSVRWKLGNMLSYLFYGHDIYYLKKINVESLIERVKGKEGVVIASGPPFTYFGIAAGIADKLGAKLILDYRDPWTYGYERLDSGFILNCLRKVRQKNLELLLLNKANIITAVSQKLRAFLPHAYNHKVKVIPNGSNSFKAINNECSDFPVIFSVIYLGTIYDEQLRDETFFKAFREFKIGKIDKVRLSLIGSNKNKSLKELIIKYNLMDVSTITERLQPEDIAYYLQAASLFLHLRYGNRSGIITSKQADYLAYRKPILLPVSDNGDLAESITKHKAGFVCNGVEETLAVLEQQYQKFLNKESCLIDQDEEYLRTNTREYIAGQFVELVNGLFEEKPSQPLS